MAARHFVPAPCHVFPSLLIYFREPLPGFCGPALFPSFFFCVRASRRPCYTPALGAVTLRLVAPLSVTAPCFLLVSPRRSLLVRRYMYPGPRFFASFWLRGRTFSSLACGPCVRTPPSYGPSPSPPGPGFRFLLVLQDLLFRTFLWPLLLRVTSSWSFVTSPRVGV